MRTRHNDALGVDTAAAILAGETPANAAHFPERRCIVTGEHGARGTLIRLALSPTGDVLPDVRARAPGRGAWIGVDRATLDQAVAKGKLRGALARAFKGAPVTVPADLGDRVEDALRRAALERMGLEARASTLVTGSERIAEAARKGSLKLLLHASDASDDGTRRLAQAWRVGEGDEGSGRSGDVLPATRTMLSVALGRENVVHVGVIDNGAASRIALAVMRWCAFVGAAAVAASLRNAATGFNGRASADRRDAGDGAVDDMVQDEGFGSVHER